MIASGERTFFPNVILSVDLWFFLALENKQEKDKEMKDEIRNEKKNR